MSTIRHLSRDLVEQQGWNPGTDIEDRAALFLFSAGFRPEETAQQHRVGPYRLDFAFPDIRVGLEVDGWHHRSPEGAAKDATRDAYLRGQGWVMLRVDDVGGETGLLDQLARVCRIVHQVRGAERRP